MLTLLVQVRIYPPDCAYYYAYPHSLLYDNDLLFDNQFAVFPFQLYELYLGPNGIPANDWPVGTGILWLPLLAWLRAGISLLARLGLAPAPNGFETASKLAAILGTSLFGLVAVWLPYRGWIRERETQAAKRRPAKWTLWLLGAAMVFGTPYGYYMFVFPATSHIPSAALLACALAGWWRWRKTPAPGREALGWVILAGASAGLLVTVRPQNLIFGVIPLLDSLLNRNPDYRTPSWAELAIAAGASALACLPQMLVWHTLYGTWLALPKIEEMHWLNPTVLPFLFSSYHGYLSWAPLCFLGAAGLALRRETWPLLAGFIAQLYVNMCNEWWWAGGSFSNRRMVECTPLLLIGLWVLFQRLRDRRLARGLAAVCVLCCAWTFTLLLAEVGKTIRLDHNQPWREIFECIPAGFLPGLAHIIPWTEIRQQSWERALVPLWLGAGLLMVWSVAAGWQARFPTLPGLKSATYGSLVCLSAVAVWFSIAAYRTPLHPPIESLAKQMNVTHWPTKFQFRWVYRFEEGNREAAHNHYWESIDAMLAATRLFDGYYQPWRVIAYSLTNLHYPYPAYFAYKEAIVRGDRTETFPAFRQLLIAFLQTRDEKPATWWNELGVIQYKTGNLPAAEEAFRKALELDPHHALARRNLDEFQREKASRAAGNPPDAARPQWYLE